MSELKKRKRDAKKVQSDSKLRPSWTEDVKRSPRWYAPLAVTIMLLGLLWIVVFYALTLGFGGYNLLGIGRWNLAVGFGVTMVGFIMLMWRKQDPQLMNGDPGDTDGQLPSAT